MCPVLLLIGMRWPRRTTRGAVRWHGHEQAVAASVSPQSCTRSETSLTVPQHPHHELPRPVRVRCPTSDSPPVLAMKQWVETPALLFTAQAATAANDRGNRHGIDQGECCKSRQTTDPVHALPSARSAQLPSWFPCSANSTTNGGPYIVKRCENLYVPCWSTISGLIRAGVRRIVEEQPDLSVVAEIGDGDAVIPAPELHDPDLLVLT